MKIITDLYNAITNFSEKYGSLKFNSDDNVSEYKKLVDLSIKYEKIPECNRYEYSTHGRLLATITYQDNRERFCYLEAE